jgi:two-component system phosphate regulon sensor histidine kinase PhoR
MQARRIFWKLYPSYLGITLLALTAVYFLSTSVISGFYEKAMHDSLTIQARFLEENVRELFAEGDLEGLRDVAGQFGEKISAPRITLIFPDGTVVGESEKSPELLKNHRDRTEILEAQLGGDRVGMSVRFSNTLRQRMMYVAVPVQRGDTVLGVVRLAMSLAEIEQVITQVQHRIILGGLMILVLAGAFSLIVSRRISRPLERIKRGAERFAQGDFSYRLNTIGSTEVNTLAETMNQMAEQLEDRLQTLTRERNQREAVLSSMVEGVLAVDTTGHIISLNKAAARFFNVFQVDTAKGRSIEEVFRNVKLQKFITEVLEGRETRECEIAVQGTGTCYLQTRGTNLLGVQGERIGAVVVFNDVSRLRRLENVRQEFVANVSHELKTPITAIKGFVETLLDGALDEPEEARRFLGIVAKHADRLNAIIEDLLTLSRLEQDGGKGMELQPVGLHGVMQSAAEVCSARASKKKIAIHIDCQPNLTAVVNPPLIEQALINLIGNAVKYSPENKTVTVRAASEPEGVTLSVQDEGFGIESEHLDRLFERFYRVDKGRSRQEGGTGLGLAIVKHIAQAHGGNVSVESTFGKGSSFSIFIPV